MQEEVTRPTDVEGEVPAENKPSAWSRIPGRTRTATAVFLVCLLFYSLALFLVPRYKGATTTHGDETHYLLIAESILRDGDVYLANNYRARDYSEYFEQDGILWHAARGRNGRWVPTHPISLSLFILPAYELFGHQGAAFLMVLLMCAAAALSFLVADRFASRPVAAVVTLFLFLSYPLIFYSRLIYPETMAVFLVSFGLWCAWRLHDSGRALYAGLMGLTSGLMVLFHPKLSGVALAFLLLFFMVRPSRDRRLTLAWLVPAAIMVLLLIVLTGAAFGGSLVRGLTASGGGKFQGGYWGTNSGWGVLGLFLDNAWGLFIFAGFYLLFVPGLFLHSSTLEWERWWAFFPVCIVVHVLLLGVFQSWNGGASPVPRYLVPLVPLFLVSIAVFLDRVRSVAARAAAVLLAALQIVTTVWAFRFFVGTYGMEASDNIFLEHFLGDGGFKKFLLAVFPVFHPTGWKDVGVAAAWVAVLVAATLASRRYYMRHGGGRLSPIVDIRPFVRVEV